MGIARATELRMGKRSIDRLLESTSGPLIVFFFNHQTHSCLLTIELWRRSRCVFKLSFPIRNGFILFHVL